VIIISGCSPEELTVHTNIFSVYASKHPPAYHPRPTPLYSVKRRIKGGDDRHANGGKPENLLLLSKAFATKMGNFDF